MIGSDNGFIYALEQLGDLGCAYEEAFSGTSLVDKPDDRPITKDEADTFARKLFEHVSDHIFER